MGAQKAELVVPTRKRITNNPASERPEVASNMWRDRGNASLPARDSELRSDGGAGSMPLSQAGVHGGRQDRCVLRVVPELPQRTQLRPWRRLSCWHLILGTCVLTPAPRAALDLQRSRWAVLHVPLRGSTSRVSTSRVAEQALAWGTILEPDELVKTTGGRGRCFSPRKVGDNDQLVKGSILERARRGGHMKEDKTIRIIKLRLPLGGEGGEEKDKLQGRIHFSEEVGGNSKRAKIKQKTSIDKAKVTPSLRAYFRALPLVTPTPSTQMEQAVSLSQDGEPARGGITSPGLEEALQDEYF
ncbi:hypothetical protein NDU88_003147 [Pleurodeles waltl]|uniref:Uncharacterized protein n=1 Tax=Pleurodeles waltl TaxID=8319 RepID=A0AAV7NJX3_PLEWA|nr:hypothetical protein NDU88_003147 [Pleurodeles waltl]